MALQRPLTANHYGWTMILVAIPVFPLLLPFSMATEILIFAIVAVAANLLVGYARLFSFGQATFFGIGGYAAGNVLIHTDLPLIVAMAGAAVVAALTATVVGHMCVRRVGIYFIMLTFAFNQMFFYIAYQWRSATGGPDGLVGIERPELSLYWVELSLRNEVVFYGFVALVFLACFWLMQRVVESPFGKMIQSIRDNPRRAASIGYDTHVARVILFAISGLFTGIAGSLYSMLYWMMPIDAISWLSSGYIIFMVLIGGTGNLFGPFIGATIFLTLQDLLSIVWARWPLVFGAIIVLVVMFFQGGILQVIERISELVRGRQMRRARRSMASGAE